MEINGHWNEIELAEFVLDSTRAVSSHLEHCDQCLDEATRLRDLIHGLRGKGEEEEEFWTTQQRAIRARIASQNSETSSKGRLAWGLATATIVVATVLVLGGNPPRPLTAPNARVDPDHELLVEVERTLQTGGPEALEPAALLAQEIGQHAIANGNSQNNNKETPHED
jgi:anti-sigma factor RsiW